MQPDPEPDESGFQPQAQPAKVVHPRRVRRSLNLVPQSAKVDDSVNHRLTLYCAATGCGAKDAFIAAVAYFLGSDQTPKPIATDDLTKIPYEVHERLQVISVRIEPALKQQIKEAAEDLGLTPSAWVNQALTDFLDAVGLPADRTSS